MLSSNNKNRLNARSPNSNRLRSEKKLLNKKNQLNPISDEQSLKSINLRSLNWVGISEVQTFVQLKNYSLPCFADLHVDLRQGYRGIHMSRLYALIDSMITQKTISFKNFDQLLTLAIESQENLATQAKAIFRFELPVKTKSLKSETSGFRKYPISIRIKKSLIKETALVTLEFEIIYSSTCPQSSKLSKEFFKKQFKNKEQLQQWFDTDQIYLATPHAQRSVMKVQLQFPSSFKIDFQKEIQNIEKILGTPVQTSVKKSDEMEFAYLNAQNTMFCEDAARKVADELDRQNKKIQKYTGYRLTVQHLESLHPHNAFSQISQNFKM